MSKKILFSIIISAFILFNINFSTAETKEPVANESSKVSAKVFKIESVTPNSNKNLAADFTWNENGKKYSFSEFTKNKSVFLNFWGTWCPPCRREIPDIVQIHNDMQGKDFVIIGIAWERDLDNALKIVKEFAEKNGISYYLFIANSDILAAYGNIPSVPTTFIIDKNKNIIEKIVGSQTKDFFMKSVNKVVK